MMRFHRVPIGPVGAGRLRMASWLAAGIGLAVAGLMAAWAGPVTAGDYPRLANKAGRPAASLAPCSGRYPLVASLELRPGLGGPALRDALRERVPGLGQLWGVEQNADTVAAPGGGVELRVRYPKGSINPSSEDQPVGGAGFVAPLAPGGLERACLRYRVRFEDGFEFRKGGKLPGLFGGEAPSGGDPVAGDSGFSTRLMWRRDGEGEVYAYVANKRGKYGASIGRGHWTFEPGEAVTVEQEVVLNDPGSANGIVRVWVDGEPVVEQADLVYRTVPGGKVDGLMFSTFFGGSSKSWKSPKDQHAWFSDFRLYGSPNE